MLRRMSALMLMVVALLWPVAGALAQPSGRLVVVLEVDGVINPLTAQYLERSLRLAEERGARLVVVMPSFKYIPGIKPFPGSSYAGPPTFTTE